MTQMIPDINEEILGFRESLRDHAKAEDVFQLDKATIELSMDVIGKVVL